MISYSASTGALDSIRLGGSATVQGVDANLANTTVDFPGSPSITRTMGSLHAPLTTTTEAANNTVFERWLGFNPLGQIDRHLRQIGAS